jgi:hypothetical protein
MTLEVRLIIASVIPVGMLMMLWHVLITRRSILALRERIARQSEALALLTETSETGFEAVAKEIARLRAAQPDPLRPLGPRRVSVTPDKAKAAAPANAPMTEGEKHLRRLFAKQTGTSRGVQAV